jgi:hypothetical protein
MKVNRPSPAMAVAFLALVLALSGTAFAAVDYARKAGAVDGRSAVGDGASRARAAGKLVATQRKGAGQGTIRQKYLDVSGLARGQTSTFGKYLAVQDNQVLAPEALGVVPGLGTLTASCFDQSSQPGREDPATRLAFANQSGDAINVARTVGPSTPFIAAVANGALSEWVISGSSTFELHIERKGVNYFVKGVVRQDGRNTSDASCLLYGFSVGTRG